MQTQIARRGDGSPALPVKSAWLVATLTFVVCATLGALWIATSLRAHDERVRDRASEHVVRAANTLEHLIASNFAPIQTLASIARQSTRLAYHFDIIASDILRSHPHLDTLTLAPDGIVSHIYPLENNRSALGTNMLDTPAHGTANRLARMSRQLTIGGPFEQPGGEPAIVGIQPVFGAGGSGQSHFWGFATATMLTEDLARLAHLDDLERQQLQYLVWRRHPISNTPQSIFGSHSAKPFEALYRPLNHSLNLPNTEWHLSALPVGGWSLPEWLPATIGLVLLMSLMMGFAGKSLVELRWNRTRLSGQVAQHSRDLDQTQLRLQGLLSASQTGAWEYHPREQAMYCSPEYFAILGYTLEELGLDPGQNIIEVCRELTHPEDWLTVQQTLQQYLESGSTETIDCQLRMRHRDGHWVKVLSRGRHLCDDQGQSQGVIFGTHTDVTRLTDAETRLDMALGVLKQSREGVLIVDTQHRIAAVNPAFESISGFTEAECLQQPIDKLDDGMYSPELLQTIVGQVGEHGFWQGEVWVKHKSGRKIPVWLSINAVRDGEQVTSHYIAMLSDISKLKQSEAEVQRLAYYDPLTQLPNRAMLEERARYTLKLARHAQWPVALLLLDIDNFKTVNDSLGHAAGNQLLGAFARRLQRCLREEDSLYRLGGDEFALLMPDTDASAAAQLATELLQRVESPFRTEQLDLCITCSIGITTFPADGDSLNQLYTNADAAMYSTKQRGRNGYSFYTPDLHTHSLRQLTLDSSLRRALDDDSFSLHYQPQRCLASGELIGMEALLRWQHPELGPVSPAEFIPLAERNGLILPLGERVLRQAAGQVRAWLDAGIKPPRIAINISPVQFRQRDLPQIIQGICADCGISTSLLELELTETITLDDPEQAADMIERLRAAGLNLAIDDFGTGYSSMSKLKLFRFSKLKIDQTFIHDITRNADDRVIVNSIISLAHSLGLRCVAEGVERPDQLELLRGMGCDDIQGYLISHPLPAQEAETYLRRDRRHLRVVSG